MTGHTERAITSDRKSTRLNSSHVRISYAVFCLKKKTHLYVSSLLQARGLALALALQGLLLDLQVATAELDPRVLLDVVAQLAAGLDVLDQAGETFGVEAVRGVEVFEVGLVEIGDGDRLELETVLRQGLGCFF